MKQLLALFLVLITVICGPPINARGVFIPDSLCVKTRKSPASAHNSSSVIIPCRGFEYSQAASSRLWDRLISGENLTYFGVTQELPDSLGCSAPSSISFNGNETFSSPIGVVWRGKCPFFEKAKIATAMGFTALVIVNPKSGPRLEKPGFGEEVVEIPVVLVEERDVPYRRLLGMELTMTLRVNVPDVLLNVANENLLLLRQHSSGQVTTSRGELLERVLEPLNRLQEMSSLELSRTQQVALHFMLGEVNYFFTPEVRPERALEHYLRVLQQDPLHLPTLSNLGDMLYKYQLRALVTPEIQDELYLYCRYITQMIVLRDLASTAPSMNLSLWRGLDGLTGHSSRIYLETTETELSASGIHHWPHNEGFYGNNGNNDDAYPLSPNRFPHRESFQKCHRVEDMCFQVNLDSFSEFVAGVAETRHQLNHRLESTRIYPGAVMAAVELSNVLVAGPAGTPMLATGSSSDRSLSLLLSSNGPIVPLHPLTYIETLQDVMSEIFRSPGPVSQSTASPTRALDSTTISGIQMSCDNLYHWLTQCLTRVLYSLEALSSSADSQQVVHLLLPGVPTITGDLTGKSLIMESLAAAGILNSSVYHPLVGQPDSSPRLTLNLVLKAPLEVIQARTLILADWRFEVDEHRHISEGLELVAPRTALNLIIRRLNQRFDTNQDRRLVILISRSTGSSQSRKFAAGEKQAQSRDIQNEGEVVTRFQETISEFNLEQNKSFEFLRFHSSSYSVAETIPLFRRAAVVVGVHGAGLTNMIYAADRVDGPQLFRVIEIALPSSRHRDYMHLSAQLGVHYHLFPVGNRRNFGVAVKPQQHYFQQSFEVDATSLADCLRHVLSS